MMEVVTLVSCYMESNIHLLCESGHAIIIDPADDQLIRSTVEESGYKVDFCILTHEHCDHTCCCEKIQNEYNCDVIASEMCTMYLNDEKMNFTKYYEALVALQSIVTSTKQKNISTYVVKVNRTFEDCIQFEWQGHKVLLKETPGHSPGSICIVVDQDIMFTGDTLFAEQETNCRFIGGSRKAFETVTLPWLMRQPIGMKVYPGHGRPFILKEKKKEKDENE